MRQEELDIRQCQEIILSQEYLDVYKETEPGIQQVAKELGAECYQQITEKYGIFHIKTNNCKDFYYKTKYAEVPIVYGLTSTSALEASGINAVLNNNKLDLSGKDVLVAILDTGIDYTHEAFRYEDNTTKILSIWDQTESGKPPEGFLYGTEYTREEINNALQTEAPLAIVPSKDVVGHGTFLAGLAVGQPNTSEGFQGAAPAADLLVVKLKGAKNCLMDFYQYKEDAVTWQSNDILQGINYVVKKSSELDRPIVILFAGGSTVGPHTGSTILEERLADIGDVYGVGVVLSAGNEGNAEHHFKGQFKRDESRMDVQLNIAEGERGVHMLLWGYLPDKWSIELISPSGETTGKLPYLIRKWQKVQFPLEGTTVNVYYNFMEEKVAIESIAVIIESPLPGLWTIVIHGDVIVDGELDIWLPLKGLVDDDTVFLKPNPYDTIVNPATNDGTITVGAYDDLSQSIYLGSSRGFTRDKRVKPDFVAPGVNVLGPYPNNQYIFQTGTSVSAAITAGATALLLEWAIIKGNDEWMNTDALKSYLARGANRREAIIYPNREWGYGELNLNNTFKIL
ncbi:S8 family peptidase [Vallitalea okinawensis]|uniref:S8 family peptidase n=1 Tax=Vallitalea okinawensis TaxID=2078660 RepID=UPI000CFE2E92|nr:S8 family peptidase [Vallitalea okinawensis]